jgi:protein-S-isoprenylcysteine O-methyltransferase Ste14
MKAIPFAIGSVILIYVSRHSFRTPRSHGFFRFFVWEFMLALFLLNEKFWFQNPFAWYQLIAWILLFTSLIPLTYGVSALISRGKPANTPLRDPTLLGFEKTTQLVTSGVYKYIRHPLYGSLLFLTWGMFFKLPSILGSLLAGNATLFLFLTAHADEAECTEFFGADYQIYMRHTKRFIPFLF